jgi:serine-aspartate repeat-containing protein C/D/E
MDVDEAEILSNSLVSDHSFEIVNIEGNSRTVSPNTAPGEQITDIIMSTPANKEQMVQLEIFDTMEVIATDLGEEQLLTDEQNDEPEANLNDSDSLLQPVVLSVQGNIEMHDETDETAILNELAPIDTETLPSDEEESHEEFQNLVDTMEPVKQSELNDDDAANKDQESNAADQESESEEESESAEQEGESAEKEGESAEQEEQTNVEEVLSEQEDESAGGHENEDGVMSDECEQDPTEEDGSSNNAEEDADKKDKDAESPGEGVDLNETVFFSPDSNKSDAEAIEATDDTDSFKSTE